MESTTPTLDPSIATVLSQLGQIVKKFRSETNGVKRFDQVDIIYVNNINSVLEIKQLLGRGDQASVSLATLVQSGKEVAVKMESKLMSSKALENFRVGSRRRGEA